MNKQNIHFAKSPEKVQKQYFWKEFGKTQPNWWKKSTKKVQGLKKVQKKYKILKLWKKSTVLSKKYDVATLWMLSWKAYIPRFDIGFYIHSGICGNATLTCYLTVIYMLSDSECSSMLSFYAMDM